MPSIACLDRRKTRLNKGLIEARSTTVRIVFGRPSNLIHSQAPTGLVLQATEAGRGAFTLYPVRKVRVLCANYARPLDRPGGFQALPVPTHGLRDLR